MEIIDLIGDFLTHSKNAVELIRAATAAGKRQPQELTAALDLVFRAQQLAEAAKKEVLALEKENLALKDEIAKCIDWKAKKQRYSLHAIAAGSFAYVENDAGDAVKNGPWYCQRCFDKGEQPSVFQFSRYELNRDAHECPSCGAVLLVPHGRKDEAQMISRKTDFDGFI